MKPPGVDPWDEILRDARDGGEAIVIRGDMIGGDFALEVVELCPTAKDPYADAAERAWEAS